MGRYADHVYQDSDTVARIEQLANQLPSGANVRITMRNGEVIHGVVAERPIVQTFEDHRHHEGLNCLLRLERFEASGSDSYVWLDQVVHVEQAQPLLHDATAIVSSPTSGAAK